MVPCRAIRGNSISDSSTLPPLKDSVEICQHLTDWVGEISSLVELNNAFQGDRTSGGASKKPMVGRSAPLGFQKPLKPRDALYTLPSEPQPDRSQGEPLV